MSVLFLVAAVASLLPPPLRDSVLQVVDTLLSLTDGLGWESARAAGQEALDEGAVGAVLAALLAVPAALFVGQLPLCAFRVKRALLNLSPDPLGQMSHAPRRSHIR